MGLKIFEDQNYIDLKKLLKTDDSIGALIIKRLEASAIICDEPSREYGKSIKDILALSEITTTVGCMYCINTVSEEIEEMFGKLYLIGTGNCPICGGDMELDEDSVHIEAFGDNGTPDDIGGEYECTNCGERQS